MKMKSGQAYYHGEENFLSAKVLRLNAEVVRLFRELRMQQLSGLQINNALDTRKVRYAQWFLRNYMDVGIVTSVSWVLCGPQVLFL
jgi:FixJ family two-component response regulator